MTSAWRVNFGNGYVHDCGSRAECQRLIDAQLDGDGYARIERYVGDGEWSAYAARAKPSTTR